MKKQDKHYKGHAFEAIDVIEWFLKMGGVPPIAAYSVGQALRYILRAGLKDGQPWDMDIEKASNYLHRALKGEWAPDDDKATEEMQQVVKRHFTDSVDLEDFRDKSLNDFLETLQKETKSQ